MKTKFFNKARLVLFCTFSALALALVALPWTMQGPAAAGGDALVSRATYDATGLWEVTLSNVVDNGGCSFANGDVASIAIIQQGDNFVLAEVSDSQSGPPQPYRGAVTGADYTSNMSYPAEGMPGHIVNETMTFTLGSETVVTGHYVEGGMGACQGSFDFAGSKITIAPTGDASGTWQVINTNEEESSQSWSRAAAQAPDTVIITQTGADLLVEEVGGATMTGFVVGDQYYFGKSDTTPTPFEIILVRLDALDETAGRGGFMRYYDDGDTVERAGGEFIASKRSAGDDGFIKWVYNLADGTKLSRPALDADGNLYLTYLLTNAATGMVMLNPDGTEAWNLPFSANIISDPALAASGVLYAFSSGVWAVTPPARSTVPTASYIYTNGNLAQLPPVVSLDEDIFFSRFDNLYSIDNTGAVNWMLGPLTSATNIVMGGDGTVYATEPQTLKAINTDTPSVRFFHQFTDVTWLGVPFVGMGGHAYVGDDQGRLHKFDKDATGDATPLWSFQVPSGTYVSHPAVAVDGTIYVAAGTQALYAVNHQTGAQEWSFTAPGTITSVAVGADGTIYVGSVGGLYALDDEGNQLWWMPGGESDNLFVANIGPDGALYLWIMSGAGVSGSTVVAVETSCGGPGETPWPLPRHDAAQTKSGEDYTLPTVTANTPADQATGVSANAVLTATFSEGVDPSTVNDGTFFLNFANLGSPVDGTVTYDAATRTATFTPDAPLTLGASYTATVDLVRDFMGNHMPTYHEWTFTVEQDTTPPAVTDVFPEPNSTGAAVGTEVTVTFSKAMDPASINGGTFTLATAARAPVDGVVSYDAGSNTAFFTPSSPLDFSVSYTATVSGSVTDQGGLAMGSNYAWSFTTQGDPIPPTVTGVTPADQATNQLAGGNLTATFSEAMDPATLNTGTFTVTYETAGAPVAVSGAVTYDAATKTATFNPTEGLPYSSMITATLTTGAKDLAGNGLAANYAWSFGTEPDTYPPVIVSLFPPANSTILLPAGVIGVEFNEDIDPATLTNASFSVVWHGATEIVRADAPVSGTLSFDAGANVAMFTPDEELTAETQYTATITTAIRDLAGNALEEGATWTFTVSKPPRGCFIGSSR